MKRQKNWDKKDNEQDKKLKPKPTPNYHSSFKGVLSYKEILKCVYNNKIGHDEQQFYEINLQDPLKKNNTILPTTMLVLPLLHNGQRIGRIRDLFQLHILIQRVRSFLMEPSIVQFVIEYFFLVSSLISDLHIMQFCHGVFFSCENFPTPNILMGKKTYACFWERIYCNG